MTTAKRPPTLNNARATFEAHLAGLTAELPERRLPATVDAISVLEDLLEAARQARAGTLVALRHGSLNAAGKRYTWPELVALTGRAVTPQAVEQWSKQHRPPDLELTGAELIAEHTGRTEHLERAPS